MGQLATVFLLTVALAEAAAGPDLPAQLTLSQALSIALSNSSIIREALARLDQESGLYQQSRSKLLPQLSISARQNFQTVNLAGIGIDLPSAKGLEGPFGSMDARVLLSQDLLNLANVRAWQSYRWRRESSRLLADDAREIVVLNVVATYLDALKAKATRDTLMNQTKLADELYRLTKDRVTHGVAAELDANRAMQKVNALEQQSQEAAQSYIAAKLSLANILQSRITADFEVTDEAAYGAGTPANRDSAFQTALATRADYRAAEASVKAAELQV